MSAGMAASLPLRRWPRLRVGDAALCLELGNRVERRLPKVDERRNGARRRRDEQDTSAEGGVLRDRLGGQSSPPVTAFGCRPGSCALGSIGTHLLMVGISGSLACHETGATFRVTPESVRSRMRISSPPSNELSPAMLPTDFDLFRRK